MNKYNGLLLEVAEKYSIRRGASEKENDWKTRLIYSICGMMAYASLWDDSEEEPVSIVHLKRKVKDTLLNYKTMYPELSLNLPFNAEELQDEIANLFLNTGIAYHRPNRIAPSMPHEESYGNLVFQRGIALESISCVSGIGFYSKRNVFTSSEGLRAMFGLEHRDLEELWTETISSASWKTGLAIGLNTEYLRLTPPFSRGYWVDRPETNGRISLLRTGMKGSQLYFLYRYSGNILEVSPLPNWQVEDYNYRSLACACLLHYDAFPPIKYDADGDLIHLQMNYLLPPRELELLKLYSWPEVCTSLPSNFKRKLPADVFKAIMMVLMDEGYTFEGWMY